LKNLLTYPLLLIVIFNTHFCFGGDATPLMIKIGNEYIDKWSNFYPSQALYEGMIQSIYNYEDLSEESIRDWLDFNREILEKIYKNEPVFTAEDRIDGRLLKTQIKKEIYKWEKESPHKLSLAIYSELISNATEEILITEKFNF